MGGLLSGKDQSLGPLSWTHSLAVQSFHSYSSTFQPFDSTDFVCLLPLTHACDQTLMGPGGMPRDGEDTVSAFSLVEDFVRTYENQGRSSRGQ